MEGKKFGLNMKYLNINFNFRVTSWINFKRRLTGTQETTRYTSRYLIIPLIKKNPCLPTLGQSHQTTYLILSFSVNSSDTGNWLFTVLSIILASIVIPYPNPIACTIQGPGSLIQSNNIFCYIWIVNNEIDLQTVLLLRSCPFNVSMQWMVASQ